MAKQTAEKEISMGLCHFCRGEFAKNKMVQHLKTCKARTTAITEQEGEETRLLHLQIEGQYRPQYWMHLEIPANASLADLDDYLRSVWLECCGHLSAFTIDGVSYSSDAEDDWGDGIEFLEGEKEEEEEKMDEEEEEADLEGTLPNAGEIAAQISQGLSQEFQADLKDVPVEQIEQKLERMFAEKLPPHMVDAALPSLKPMLGYMAAALQEGTLAEQLEEFADLEEDGEPDMFVELGEVLKVGDRFSYIYDFGSSTHLSLRVLAERDGPMLMPPDDELEDELEEIEEEDEDEEGDEISITVMAQNEPPALVCHLCGNPATYISSVEDFDKVSDSALCESCAQKQEESETFLPIVNSPRVGVCDYSGEDEMEDDWDEEDEEWDEEEEDEK